MSDEQVLAESGDPPLDERLRALSNRHRRRCLHMLLDRPTVDETELLREIGESEDSDFEAVVVGVYHVHLPMLDRKEFVDWDRSAGEIHRGPLFDAIESVLEALLDSRVVSYGDQ